MLQEAQQARSNFLAGDVKPRYINPFVQEVVYLFITCLTSIDGPVGVKSQPSGAHNSKNRANKNKKRG
jgi:hypothetical protein